MVPFTKTTVRMKLNAKYAFCIGINTSKQLWLLFDWLQNAWKGIRMTTGDYAKQSQLTPSKSPIAEEWHMGTFRVVWKTFKFRISPSRESTTDAPVYFQSPCHKSVVESRKAIICNECNPGGAQLTMEPAVNFCFILKGSIGRSLCFMHHIFCGHDYTNLSSFGKKA
uniref:Uncharacterized protein n=1 Tax=Glossina pallidipes TaxID=7398 RepID=A0A1A9ZUK5_GLOPL